MNLDAGNRYLRAFFQQNERLNIVVQISNRLDNLDIVSSFTNQEIKAQENCNLWFQTVSIEIYIYI